MRQRLRLTPKKRKQLGKPRTRRLMLAYGEHALPGLHLGLAVARLTQDHGQSYPAIHIARIVLRECAQMRDSGGHATLRQEQVGETCMSRRAHPRGKYPHPGVPFLCRTAEAFQALCEINPSPAVGWSGLGERAQMRHRLLRATKRRQKLRQLRMRLLVIDQLQHVIPGFRLACGLPTLLQMACELLPPSRLVRSHSRERTVVRDGFCLPTKGRKELCQPDARVFVISNRE